MRGRERNVLSAAKSCASKVGAAAGPTMPPRCTNCSRYFNNSFALHDAGHRQSLQIVVIAGLEAPQERQDQSYLGIASNALSSAAAVGGRLRRIVRPEGQKGAPKLKDGCGPGKSAGPRKGCSVAKMIAGGACCTSARGQKGLKPTKRTQAKPRRAPKPPRRNLGERRSAGVNGGLHKAEYEGTNKQDKLPAVCGSA